MKFNRAHPEDQSLVERAILNGLGVESLDFQPTAPREKIVPQRILDQRKRASKQKSAQAQTASAV